MQTGWTLLHRESDAGRRINNGNAKRNLYVFPIAHRALVLFEGQIRPYSSPAVSSARRSRRMT